MGYDEEAGAHECVKFFLTCLPKSVACKEHPQKAGCGGSGASSSLVAPVHRFPSRLMTCLQVPEYRETNGSTLLGNLQHIAAVSLHRHRVSLPAVHSSSVPIALRSSQIVGFRCLRLPGGKLRLKDCECGRFRTERARRTV